jgi:hypothetical protein
MLTCKDCRDTGWVCEAHPTKPWTGTHGCGCGAAVMPCPRCTPDSAWDTAPVHSGILRSAMRVAGKKAN